MVLDFGFGNQLMDAKNARINAQQLENQQKQKELENQNKLEGVMRRASDRMDSYYGNDGGGNNQDQGLQQVGGPSDGSTPYTGTGPGTDPNAPGLQPTGPAGNPHHQVGFGLYQNPSLFANPKFLNDTAKDFMASGLPEGVKWLEAGYKAQKEGLIEALQRANGGDLRGAEQAFNNTGEHKVQPNSLQWKDNNRTTLVGKNEDGSDFEVKPAEMLRNFLSPKDFFENQSKSRQLEIEQQKAENEKQLDSARADFYRHYGGFMDRRQNGAITPKDQKNLDFKMGALISRMLADQRQDNGMGGTQLVQHPLKDYQGSIASRASQLMRDYNYEIDPADAIERAMTEAQGHVAGIQQDTMSALDQYDRNYEFTDFGNKRQLGKLRNNIDALKQKGYTMQEIRKAAGNRGSVIDRAAKANPYLEDNNAAGGRKPAPAPNGKDYSSLFTKGQ